MTYRDTPEGVRQIAVEVIGAAVMEAIPPPVAQRIADRVAQRLLVGGLSNEWSPRATGAVLRTKALEMWNSGRSPRQIQAELGVSRATVYRWLRPGS